MSDQPDPEEEELSDPLDRLWMLFEVHGAVLAATEAAWWPAGTLDALVAMKLLVPAEVANMVHCPACDERHVEAVETRRDPGGTLRYFVRCEAVLRAEVPADLLRQWRPDHQALARRVKELLGVDGRATAHVPGRLWRLGVVPWPMQPREAYLARGLAWPDGPAVAGQVPCDARPVVFVGMHGGPPTSVWPAGTVPPPVVSLAAVLRTGRDGQLELDHALLAAIVSGADRTAAAAGEVADARLRRRVGQIAEQRLADGGRADLIAGLRRAGMTTRQIEAELKRRGLPYDHSSVARKVADIVESPPVPSSKSVLRHRSSQPCNTRGKPIPDAQPKDEQ